MVPSFRYPFGENSVYNRPIGTGANYESTDHPRTVVWRTHAPYIFVNTGIYGATACLGRMSDPLRTIAWSGYGAAKGGVLANGPVTIRMPADEPWWTPRSDDATTTIGDRFISVYQEETDQVFEFFRFRKVNNTADLLRVYSGTGLGHATQFSDLRVGGSASGMGMFCGALRPEDILATGERIAHTHQFATSSVVGFEPHVLGRGVRIPAHHGDGHTTNPNTNTGSFFYGDLVAIPPQSKGGPNLNNLNFLTGEIGWRYAESFRDYGINLIDNGQRGLFRCSSQLPTSINSTNFRADLRMLVDHCRRVTNSWTGGNASLLAGDTYTRSGDNIGTLVGSGGKPWPAGGGEPLAPNIAANGNGGSPPPAEPQMATSMGAVVRRIVPA